TRCPVDRKWSCTGSRAVRYDPRVTRLILVLAGLVLLGPVPAAAEIYRYTDATGSSHYVEGIESVPQEYRARAVPVGLRNAPAGAPTPAPAGPGGPGSDDGAFVVIESLEVGEARVGRMQVASYDVAGAGDGLLGRDFLDRFSVNIDSAAGVVTLSPKSTEREPASRRGQAALAAPGSAARLHPC